MDPDLAESHSRLLRSLDNDIESLEVSIRALKSRRNSLAPISRLPPETMATIFSFVSSPGIPILPSPNAKPDRLVWLRVAHVCHLWREIALNQPRFWSHIDFAVLTSAGTAEMLVRAKTAPLFLEAEITHHWEMARISAFQEEVGAHISHTAHLTIVAESAHLKKTLERLVSPAPILEALELTNESPSGRQPWPWERISIPDTLLGGIAPKLSYIELGDCDISWKSPLFRGLRRLEIYRLTTPARPSLEDWLNTLNEIPQLEALILHYATPLATQCPPLTSEPDRTVTLPSLTQIDITACAEDCAVALAHLVLPALTWLHVNADSHHSNGNDVRAIIPYISRNAHGPQDAEPLQSILIYAERMRPEIFVWNVPDADVEVRDPITLLSSALSARVFFSATGSDWVKGTDTVIFNALLAALPIDSLSTITAQNRLSKKVWARQAPRLSLLERVRLVPTALGPFCEMLSEAEDVAPNLPLLPSLTKLILVNDRLTQSRTYHLRDFLIKRVEQAVPIETLDLRTCTVTDHVIQLLAEIVVDVRGPANT
jgi:F-box-like